MSCQCQTSVTLGKSPPFYPSGDGGDRTSPNGFLNGLNEQAGQHLLSAMPAGCSHNSGGSRSDQPQPYLFFAQKR